MKWIMDYWKVTKQTVQEFLQDKPMRYSSSIAFYLIFSLPALLLIMITIAGSAFEDQVVRQNVLEQIQQLYGQESAQTLDKILTNARDVGSSFWAKAMGVGTLIFSATTVFVSLQDGLNSIWGLEPKPEKDWLNFLRSRLLSLAMVVSIGFLLLVSLALDTGMAVFEDLLTELISDAGYYLIAFANVIISLVIITLVFALIFKLLPDANIHWRDVWVGALVTTILFSGGKYLIGFYLGNSSLASVYGAAGSLVLILIWVFYSSVIVLFGAEFTYVYSRELGSNIRPYNHAVAIKEIEKENEQVNK